MENDTLVLGQTVALEVQIIDGRIDGVPEFPVEPGLQARYRGQGQTRSIINMKTTRIVRYSYQLTAVSEGEWTLGPFALEVDGKPLTHPALTIEVQAASAEEQAQVSVEAALSDDAPFVGELVTYNVTFRRTYNRYRINEPLGGRTGWKTKEELMDYAAERGFKV